VRCEGTMICGFSGFCRPCEPHLAPQIREPPAYPYHINPHEALRFGGPHSSRGGPG